MAGVAGFEPAHGDTKNRCLTAWLHPTRMILYKNGAVTRTRTADLMITNQLLYQLSYYGTPNLSSYCFTVLVIGQGNTYPEN